MSAASQIQKYPFDGFFHRAFVCCDMPNERSRLQAEAFFPLSNSLFFSHKNNVVVSTFINALLRSSRPIAIFWRIPEIIIASLYRMFFRRSCAHIGVKSPKIFGPPFTHTNASPAIMRIFWPVRIATPTKHSKPDLVLWSLSKPMGNGSLAGCFSPKTSARLGIPASQVY